MAAPGVPPPNVAIVFDIDGVLVHGMWHSACQLRRRVGSPARCHASVRMAGVRIAGPKPVPGAREALQRVVNARVPHVFVTNNGQQDESARAARLQRVLDLPVDPARMILCQTPLKACNPEGGRLGIAQACSTHEKLG